MEAASLEPSALRLLRLLGASAAAGFLALAAMVAYLLANRRPRLRPLAPGDRGPGKASRAGHGIEDFAALQLNLQRKAAIAYGRPMDHLGAVVTVPDETFDLNATIFQALEGALERFVTRSKLGVRLYWAEERGAEIQAAYEKIPRGPDVDAPVLRFMLEDCDLTMEHADGSFMDHLSFCQAYSAAHFPGRSPRVMLLHSIMGVGTNIFPMRMEKLPKLKALVTDAEFRQIEAFPSFLRLLNERQMLEHLSASAADLDRLESVTVHRVLDNAQITLKAGDFWDQLNYQLIHLLDFLPAANWAAQESEPLFSVFVELFMFLSRNKRLTAHVDFSWTSRELSLEGQPLSLGACIYRYVPSALARKLQRKAIRKFSAKIGHSLNYEIRWAS